MNINFTFIFEANIKEMPSSGRLLKMKNLYINVMLFAVHMSRLSYY